MSSVQIQYFKNMVNLGMWNLQLHGANRTSIQRINLGKEGFPYLYSSTPPPSLRLSSPITAQVALSYFHSKPVLHWAEWPLSKTYSGSFNSPGKLSNSFHLP